MVGDHGPGSQDFPYHLEFDGAARGNPGHGGIGAVLISPTQEHRYAIVSRCIGPNVSNNEAEYEALIAGLEGALAFGVKHVWVRGDSELVVKQVTGEYKASATNMQILLAQVQYLQGKFDSFEISHVAREFNAIADGLANQAINEALSEPTMQH